MKYKRSILRGYDKAIKPLIAKALHMPVDQKKTSRKVVRHK